MTGKKFLFLIFPILSILTSFGQAGFNKEKSGAKFNRHLITLLDSILKTDQEDRLKLDSIQTLFGAKSKQSDSLWKKINYQDSVNLIKVKQIIDTYGWLGNDEIGEDGARTIFLVIQHSDSLTQVTYAPIMRESVKKGKANASHLALLEDRILIQQGKKQIYGSQVILNKETGKPEFFPIADEWDVNKRRAAVGLEPIEKYANSWGIEYVLPVKP